MVLLTPNSLTGYGEEELTKWAQRVSFSLVNYNTRKWEVNVNFSVLKIIHIVKPHFVKEGREEGFPTATSESLPCSLTISIPPQKKLFFPMIWPLLMVLKMLFPV